MRRPCRVAQPQGGIAVDFPDRLIELADRARTTRRLNGGNAVRRDAVTKNHLAHGIAERLVAAKRLVGLGRLHVVKHDLCLLYRRHDRGIAVGILKHAYTKVDLALAWVSGVKLAETKDRIGGNGLEVFEHDAAFHCPG